MVILSTISCGNFGEDDLVARKLDDGTVVLEVIAKDRSIQRHPVEDSDTLRVSSEIWGEAPPNMESELVIVSRTGSERHVTHFECTATFGGVHADEVGAFASVVADACGCGVDVLPTKEREIAPTPAPRPPPRSEPPPRPSYILYVDRPGVEKLASLEHLNALKLPDGTVIIERATTGIFHTIGANDTLVVSPWPHTIGAKTVETWLIRLGTSGSLGEFEWNPATATGISTEDVVAFAEAVSRVTGCKVTTNER